MEVPRMAPEDNEHVEEGGCVPFQRETRILGSSEYLV